MDSLSAAFFIYEFVKYFIAVALQLWDNSISVDFFLLVVILPIFFCAICAYLQKHFVMIDKNMDVIYNEIIKCRDIEGGG